AIHQLREVGVRRLRLGIIGPASWVSTWRPGPASVAQIVRVLDNASGIATGPDGNLWFTEEVIGGRIGRITPQGSVTEYLLPTKDSYARGITAGPDGRIWFMEHATDRIGALRPSPG